MNPTRRSILGAVAGTGLAGCLRLGQSSEESIGSIACGEETHQPSTGERLTGIGTDWPAPQHDIANTGFNPAVSTTETRCGQTRWIRELADEQDGVVGAPTLRDETVFVSRRDSVVAVDARSGTESWSVPVPHEIWTTPVVGTDRVFVGTRNGVVAISIADRQVDWQAPLQQSAFDDIDGRGWVSGAPTVGDEYVFAGTKAGQFAALDAVTGETVWSTTTDLLPDGSASPENANLPVFDGPAAVADGTVVIGNWNGQLYAFDASSGEELWTRTGDTDYEPAPTVVGETVLATTETTMAAVRLTDGTVEWTYSGDPGSVTLSATVVDGTAHVAAGDSYSSLSVISLDLTDRSVAWRTDGRPQTSAGTDGATLYLGLYGNLVAIDRQSGEVAWEMRTESVLSGPPIVTAGAVIALDERGFLYGVDTTGG
ncbi:PQQ-binding-like beta-propeller repeat protein [Haloarchaeobius sp. HME9146]|uniref:outer membrane protein assembly factor BamB family protein n=1 Tax=Haloarchaeobius sp. HME9146 TaxID=2978732 RepID=UPI0021C0CBAC|nr:PQQ-binding-like beta-propeller repeat protein [Haloarchaeobius sp. HME9146]MCT9097937.1 PQQ-binding-like beta-propeller repeat protein [Haloarchaeobius sp. HME9146]